MTLGPSQPPTPIAPEQNVTSSHMKFHVFSTTIFAMKWHSTCYKMVLDKLEYVCQHAMKWHLISLKMVSNVVLTSLIAGYLIIIIMIFHCGLMVHITDTRTQKVVSYTSAHITETVLAHDQHWEEHSSLSSPQLYHHSQKHTKWITIQ